jgi:hypothetical protein
VASNIKARPDGVFYIGTDGKIYRMYYTATGWSYEAITPTGGWGSVRAGGDNNMLVSSNVLIGGALALAPWPSTNVYFRSNTNTIFNLVGSTGSWTMAQISPSNAVACGGSIITDNQEVFYLGTDAQIHMLLYWSNWIYIPMTSTNNSAYTAAEHLTKLPGDNRVFFKGKDGLAYNIYLDASSQWEVWALRTDANTVLADLIVEPSHVYYISTTKMTRNFWWDGTTWQDNALDYSIANVKGCSQNYRTMETNENSVSGDTPEESLSFDGLFPNPANDQVTLSYTMKADKNVTISVFNTLGQQVAGWSDSDQQSLTARQSVFSVKGFTPGLYIVTLELDGQQKLFKKMLVK